MVFARRGSSSHGQPEGLSFGDLKQGDTTGRLIVSQRVTFQLEHLHWAKDWDDFFVHFLKTQKSLKTLSLSNSIAINPGPVTNAPISQSVGSGLTALYGDERVVEALLPFAPGITHVALEPTPYGRTDPTDPD